MNIKYLFILPILLLAIGCTDLKEEVFESIPYEKYPEDASQVAGISVEAYSYLRPLIDDEGWWFLAQEVSSDEMVFPTRDTDWDDGGKWRVMHSHDWNNDVEAVNNMWAKLYEAVVKNNQIIDRLRSLPQNDNVLRKIKEVEVMRSFYYYLLLDNFGDVPYLTSAIDVPELPLKNKRADIFDSLTVTVEKALPMLKAIDNKYLATRYMAFSLLAKLYLNAEVYTGTANWPKALQYTDSVMAGPYTLATDVFSPFKTDNENSSEIIFSIPFDEDNFKGFRLHMRTLHYQHNETYDMPVGPWNGGAVVESFFNKYADNDLRKGWFLYGPQYNSQGQPIIESSVGAPLNLNPYIPALILNGASNTPSEIRMSGARIAKYEIKKGAKENLSNDFPLFRISDFYLMKSELEIRLGNNGDEWVNPIRERAEIDKLNGATLDDVYEERGREMFAEGHRRQDQIRFGKWEKPWWEKPATTKEREIFPIPKWAIDANPNLDKDPI